MKAVPRVPMLPNFVTVDVGPAEIKMDVADLDDVTLDEMATRWTLRLKAHAKQRRENRTADSAKPEGSK